MKPSGKHKHDKENELGEHTHDYEDLDDEGLKLIVKGKLKNLPNFSFKKPKSEKQKKDAKEKREEKKKNKQEKLNELIDTIENNFSKFQQKKQIAQQSSGSSIPIPIYIPQYTQPTGNNLNIDTLSEINDMILKKENELKQYYEKEYKKSFSEVDNKYRENNPETELPSTSTFIPSDTSPEYENKLKELNDYYNELIKFRDVLLKERDELSKKSNTSQQERNEYNIKLEQLDDLYNQLLRERQELEEFRIEEEKRAIGDFTNIRLPSQLTQQEETEFIPPSVVPPLNLELFGSNEDDERFETPRDDIIQPQLTLQSQTEFEPIQLPPPLPIPQLIQTEESEFIPQTTPKLSEGFELVEFEEPELPTRPPLILSQEQEEERARPISEDIVDLLDILDDTVINKFKQTRIFTDLEDLNQQQEEIIDAKQIQLQEQQNLIDNLEENLFELSEQDRDVREQDKLLLEEELRLRLQELEQAKDEKEKLEIIKEAEILEIKLKGADNTKQLKDAINKIKEEKLKTEKELESLELLNQEMRERKEQDIDRIDRNTTDAEKKLLERDNNYYVSHLQDLGIPDNLIPRRDNALTSLYEMIQGIDLETRQSRINNILQEYGPNMTQKKFMEELVKERESIVDVFKRKEEEELLKKIEEEKQDENINEEMQSILIAYEKDIENKTKEKQNKQDEIQSDEDIIASLVEETKEVQEEIENLINSISSELENKGILSVDDIDKIENESEREEMKENYEFIEHYINELTTQIELSKDDIKQKIKKVEKKKNQLMKINSELDKKMNEFRNIQMN